MFPSRALSFYLPANFYQQGSKGPARFELNAAGWDDMPIKRGIAELERSWIESQVEYTYTQGS